MIEVFKDINARWLITGEGEMLESEIKSSNREVAEPLPAYGQNLFELYVAEVRKNGMLEERIRIYESEHPFEDLLGSGPTTGWATGGSARPPQKRRRKQAG